ncbi:MAG: MATE family efflux transporter, partial [Gammaproteobacteria bacterium]
GGWQWVKILNHAEIRRIMAINGDIFIRTLCLIFVFAFFNVQSAGLGELMLAANTVLLQFQMFMAYALDGFAHAAESLIGQAVGGRDRTRFRQSVNTAALWSVSLAAVFTSAYALFGSRIIDLLTDLEPVRSTAYTYLPWVAAAPLVSVWCYLLDGIFIGATLSRAMRNTMLASTVFCYLPAWYFTRDLLNHGLWLSLLLFMAARGLSMGWVYRKTTLFH